VCACVSERDRFISIVIHLIQVCDLTYANLFVVLVTGQDMYRARIHTHTHTTRKHRLSKENSVLHTALQKWDSFKVS